MLSGNESSCFSHCVSIRCKTAVSRHLELKTRRKPERSTQDFAVHIRFKHSHSEKNLTHLSSVYLNKWPWVPWENICQQLNWTLSHSQTFTWNQVETRTFELSSKMPNDNLVKGWKKISVCYLKKKEKKKGGGWLGPFQFISYKRYFSAHLLICLKSLLCRNWWD